MGAGGGGVPEPRNPPPDPALSRIGIMIVKGTRWTNSSRIGIVIVKAGNKGD